MTEGIRVFHIGAGVQHCVICMEKLLQGPKLLVKRNEAEYSGRGKLLYDYVTAPPTNTRKRPFDVT